MLQAGQRSCALKSTIKLQHYYITTLAAQTAALNRQSLFTTTFDKACWFTLGAFGEVVSLML